MGDEVRGTRAGRSRDLHDEARLLLEESNHRVGNEIAAAIAALLLIRSARGSRGRWRLLETAVARLEAFAASNRLLAQPARRSVDVGIELDRLVRAVAAARPAPVSGSVALHLQDVVCDGATARRLLLIAAEVVANGLRHGIGDGGTRLDVHLLNVGAEVILVVSDDGPGFRQGPDGGTGRGTGIVDALAMNGGGRVERRSSERGVTVEVSLPVGSHLVRRNPHRA